MDVSFWGLDTLDFDFLVVVWLFNFFNLATRESSTFSVVGSVERGATEGSVDGPFVHDDGVLHVVAVKRHDGDDKVLSAGAVVKVGRFHGLGTRDGALWVMQNVRTCVGAHSVVGAWQSEGLLYHGCSTSNTWR